MSLGRYTIQLDGGRTLGEERKTEGGVLAFESADFFMDQTYFSVCYYVIIKAM